MLNEISLTKKLKIYINKFNLKIEKKDFKLPRVLPANFRTFLTRTKDSSQVISFVVKIKKDYFAGIRFVTYNKALTTANGYICFFYDKKKNFYYQFSFYKIFNRKLNERQILSFFINEFNYYLKRFIAFLDKS